MPGCSVNGAAWFFKMVDEYTDNFVLTSHGHRRYNASVYADAEVAVFRLPLVDPQYEDRLLGVVIGLTLAMVWHWVIRL